MFAHPAPLFTALCVAALSLSFGLRLWLHNRQIAHIARHRARVPEAFADKVSLTAHQHAADYNTARQRLARIQLGVELAGLLILTWGGGLHWLSGMGIAGWPLVSGALLLLAMAFFTAALELPFDLWRTFRIEAAFGFNRQTPGDWLLDLVKQTLLGLALGLPLLLLVLWLMQQAGANWWLWAWLAWSGFNLLLLAIYPTWIAPRFNRFTPLEDGALKTAVEDLLDRCGEKVSGIFVMDGSRRSNHGNAYFAGIGASRRVVFYDTLLKQLSPPEATAVLAHELGHHHHRHLQKRLAALFALSFALLALLAWLKDAAWFYQGLNAWPISAGPASDALALALFMLILPLFSFPLAPAFSGLSRRHEFEADQFAKAHTSGADLARALVNLYNENAATLTPDPRYSLFHDSHPQPAERIARLQPTERTP